MKEVDKHPDQFKLDPPTLIASIVIDPTRYSHLLVYENYCHVAVGNIISPTLDKHDVDILLKEMGTISEQYGHPRSKLSAVKYTPMTVKIGKCILVGKSGYDGLIKALEIYKNGGPYIKDGFFIEDNSAGVEIITKERIESIDWFSWWNITKHKFGSGFQFIIVGPYETFKYYLKGEVFIDQLIEGVEYLLNNDASDFKIDISESQGYDPNLRLFKQMVGGVPYIGISTDLFTANQRSLIFASEESGKRFLTFLRKAKLSF